MKQTKLFKFIKKHWIVIWLVLSVFALTVFFVAAEYITDHNRVKRVISVTSSKAQLFSSDRLEKLTNNGVPEKKWYNVEDKEAEAKDGFFELPVHIWDFDPANPKVYYEGDLNYTISAELVNGAGGSIVATDMKYTVGEEEKTITIKIKDHNESVPVTLRESDWAGTETATKKKIYTKSHTLSETIEVNGVVQPNTEHTVTLYFDTALLNEATNNDVRIKLTATPVGHQDLTSLSAIIGVKMASKALPSGWSGELQETSDYSNYDGFNYEISGYGIDTLVLYYRSDKLEINKWNYDKDSTVASPALITSEDLTKYSAKLSLGTWSKLVISANSETKSRYSFQLYLTDGTDTFADIEDYIYFPNNDKDE